MFQFKIMGFTKLSNISTHFHNIWSYFDRFFDFHDFCRANYSQGHLFGNQITISSKQPARSQAEPERPKWISICSSNLVSEQMALRVVGPTKIMKIKKQVKNNKNAKLNPQMKKNHKFYKIMYLEQMALRVVGPTKIMKIRKLA